MGCNCQKCEQCQHEQLSGYTTAPSLAWSGWRLRIPGGPYGGQYHGFIAPDDTIDGMGWPAGRSEIYREADSKAGLGALPHEAWDPEWSGIPLEEGENLSDYVYRSAPELRPRPNASGGTNVVRAGQARRQAGFAVAPGNYKYLDVGDEPGLGVMLVNGGGRTWWPRYRTLPAVAPMRPAPIVIDGTLPSTVRYLGPPTPAPGATATVPQPPPPSSPAPAPSIPDPACTTPGWYRDAAGNCTPDWRNPYSLYLPQSPRPAPTVAASPDDYLPSQGQVVPGITPPASTGIMDWLQQTTLMPSWGVPNWGVLAGGVAAAALLFGGRRR